MNLVLGPWKFKLLVARGLGIGSEVAGTIKSYQKGNPSLNGLGLDLDSKDGYTNLYNKMTKKKTIHR